MSEYSGNELEINQRGTGSDCVYSIPPGAPFLKTLAVSLVEGRLVEGFKPSDNPFILSQATIYLPTRRAARALADEFLPIFGNSATLQPNIVTFGDSGDDEVMTGIEPANLHNPDLRDAISAHERKKCLSLLIRHWTDSISQDSRKLFGEEEIVIPSSTAEAVRMAGDLARLFDQVETEEISWSAISKLAEAETDENGQPAAWAHWWNLTLQFLNIVSEYWPSMLLEMGLSDPAERRRTLLDLRAQHYLKNGSRGPVIAAGSTGSVPATARLIAAIASLENGVVILPGLDCDATDGKTLEKAGLFVSRKTTELQSALSTHPQFGLARLVNQMGIPPEMVTEIGNVDRRLQARAQLISLAMLPAPMTGAWAQAGPVSEAVENLAIIEAYDDREEALAIALAMREALETEGKTAALTTPDRNLARRVASELRRFNIVVDDSGGIPLSSSEQFGFALQVLNAALGKPDAVAATSLIKHPLLCGEADSRASDLARLFEIAILRDAVGVAMPGNLAAGIEKRRRYFDASAHVPKQVQNLQEEDWQDMAAMADTIDSALEPLLMLGRERTVAFGGAMAALHKTLQGFLAPEVQGRSSTTADDFEYLLEFIEGFANPDSTDLMIRPNEIGSIFTAFAEDMTLRQTDRTHPRLSILGPLEARLQAVDLMLLGGLNEGVWPAPGKNDPFLNRPMKAALGMSLPERRIGLSAHDFQQLSGQGEVIYSRSLRSANAPTIASRWLQRFMTVAGDDQSRQMRERGQHFVELARMVDAPDKVSKTAKGPSGRPCPKPAVALRPTRLSITEIETWIRDPYAIFARHVLGLKPLPSLLRVADPMLKGSVFHKILERFVEEGDDGEPLKRMSELCTQTFDEFGVPDDVAGVWRKRFDIIAGFFIDWDENRKASIQRSHCEQSGKYVFSETGFELRGRADRIDVMRDGSFTILDYKTGLNPSIKQARTLSPQLALEAKMAELGAFAIPGGLDPGDIAYVRLRPGDQLRVDWICGGRDPVSLRELADDVWANLGQMITAYSNQDQGYQSRRAPFREADITGDYDHLARTREWMVQSETAGEGDG